MNTLDAQTVAMAEQMISDGLAKRIDAKGSSGSSYWYLSTPGTPQSGLTVIASLGSPEICGVWSYTLLTMGMIEETSMASYFNAFAAAGLGLIAINPNCNGPDLMGEAFLEQFAHAAATLNGHPFGLLGFSMGGGMALQFIESDDTIAQRVKGLVLIDPTLPGRFRPRYSNAILRHNTKLIASEDPMNPGQLAAQILDIPAQTFPGLHGEMPHRAMADSVAYFRGL